MQAVRLHRTAADGTKYSVSNPAPPAALVFEHKVPLPQLTAPGQVLVLVHASTVTRDELTWPESYATDFPILGHDLAGVVVATYDGTSGFKPGDEVYGMVGQEAGCSWAQYVVAEDRELALKPKGLSWTESAAVAMNGLTAWQALFEKAKFPEPDFSAVDKNCVMQQRTLLVTGAAGMVGSWIVQLARLAGIPVTAATSSNARNAAFLKSLGAYKTIEYAELGASSTKYDAIIDTAGGEPQARCWDVVADDGILISVDSGSFGIADNKPLGKEHVEALFFIVQISGAQMARLTPALEAGLVETFVSEVYPLAEARTAYERASGRLEKRGKVVLSIEA